MSTKSSEPTGLHPPVGGAIPDIPDTKEAAPTHRLVQDGLDIYLENSNDGSRKFVGKGILFKDEDFGDIQTSVIVLPLDVEHKSLFYSPYYDAVFIPQTPIGWISIGNEHTIEEKNRGGVHELNHARYCRLSKEEQIGLHTSLKKLLADDEPFRGHMKAFLEALFKYQPSYFRQAEERLWRQVHSSIQAGQDLPLVYSPVNPSVGIKDDTASSVLELETNMDAPYRPVSTASVCLELFAYAIQGRMPDYEKFTTDPGHKNVIDTAVAVVDYMIEKGVQIPRSLLEVRTVPDLSQYVREARERWESYFEEEPVH